MIGQFLFEFLKSDYKNDEKPIGKYKYILFKFIDFILIY